MVRNHSVPLKDVVAGIDDNVLVRTRLLSRAVTAIYNDKLRPFGTSCAQFALLALIGQTEPTTRAEIARHQHLDKSTLTRNLRTILSEGWAEEVRENADGRSRPLALTSAGWELLLYAKPAWLAAQAETRILLGKEGLSAVVNTADRIIHSELSCLRSAITHEESDPGIEHENNRA